MTENAHELIRQDRGHKLWGQCSCGMWCWLGTYHMPKGRLATLRTEHAKHVAHEDLKRKTAYFLLTDGSF